MTIQLLVPMEYSPDVDFKMAILFLRSEGISTIKLAELVECNHTTLHYHVYNGGQPSYTLGCKIIQVARRYLSPEKLKACNI